MQLTKEQTRRINDFLEGISIDYIDIRFEMVDHIATEIENKVEDTDAFFENKRFQTIFVKYMLSKKDSLQKKYEKIVKRRFWGDFKIISKDMLKESIKIKNISFLTILLASTYSLSLFNLKNTFIVLLVLSIIIYFYIGYVFHQTFKKFGNIKSIQSYTLILTFISYIPLYVINNPFTVFSETNLHTWNLYMHVVFIYLIFLLYRSFICQRENIEAKYQYLIQ